jgi:glycosyltransferase involved in cell wall biosynthesis
MIPYVQEAFVEKGWSMEMFSLPKRVRGKGAEDVQFETFDWRRFAGNPVVDKYIQTFKDYLWWSRLRMQKTYDLIHAHHPIAGLAMKRLFPKTPVIITIHSSFERELILNGKIQPGGPEEKFLTSLYGELENQLDGLLTVSHSFKQYLSNHVKNSEAITVIPNGFDERRFRPVTHENAVAQLITVCRLVPAKGLDVLLEACSELKKRGASFVLHLIGDGPIREELEQMAVRLNIYDETIFYGYMLHPEQFMPFFDIFVLPSRAEAFGSVFAEAALCQLALVGTEIGGIAEQIEHGVNGLLVPVNDPVALADALQRLMDNPAYRNKLAHAAWEKAKNVYSLSRVIGQMEQVYRSIAGAKSA